MTLIADRKGKLVKVRDRKPQTREKDYGHAEFKQWVLNASKWVKANPTTARVALYSCVKRLNRLEAEAQKHREKIRVLEQRVSSQRAEIYRYQNIEMDGDGEDFSIEADTGFTHAPRTETCDMGPGDCVGASDAPRKGGTGTSKTS